MYSKHQIRSPCSITRQTSSSVMSSKSYIPFCSSIQRPRYLYCKFTIHVVQLNVININKLIKHIHNFEQRKISWSRNRVSTTSMSSTSAVRIVVASTALVRFRHFSSTERHYTPLVNDYNVSKRFRNTWLESTVIRNNEDFPIVKNITDSSSKTEQSFRVSVSYRTFENYI